MDYSESLTRMEDRSSAKRLSLSWDQVLPVGTGLWNVGNTCFMNSVLQCLSYTAPLANYMLSGEHLRTCSNYRFCMSCTLQNHITETIINPDPAIVPFNMVTKLSLIGEQFFFGQQADAHKFLRYTVRALQQSYPYGKVLDRETNLIDQIFVGCMRSRVKCLNCKADSDTFEPYMDVALDITGATDLTELLRRFVQPKQLGYGYKCTRCMVTSSASKTLTIHRSSNVLTICLKRSVLYGQKISTLVKYPNRLDMRPFMSESEGESQVYKLYAVLVHAGDTCHFGHYYCYVKSSDGMWYKMNDEHVSVADERSVLDQQAYTLFYIRTSTYRKRSETCDTKQPGTVKRKRCPSLQPAAKRPLVKTPITYQELLKISEKYSKPYVTKQQSTEKRKRRPSSEGKKSQPAAKRSGIKTPATDQQLVQERKKLQIRTSEKPKAKKKSQGYSGSTSEKCSKTCDTKQQSTGKRKRCPSPEGKKSQPAAKRALIETPTTNQQLVQERKKQQIRKSEKLKPEKRSHGGSDADGKCSGISSTAQQSIIEKGSHSIDKQKSPPAAKQAQIKKIKK